MPKSAFDRLLEIPKKKLTEMLGCPYKYDVTGIYTLSGKCMMENDLPSKDVCYICWTKKV